MIPESVRIESYAKLNLFLELLGRREDGYHEVVTVMQKISLSDVLSVTRIDAGVELACSGAQVPLDRTNLAARGAAAVLERIDGAGGVRIEIDKRIPVGAGLGGGSSNAAAAMVAVNRLYGEPLTRGELALLGGRIGSDVPFFFHPGAALCTGRGERIEQSASGPRWQATLWCPGHCLSTAAVYGALDGGGGPRRDGRAFWERYRCADTPADFSALMFNRLEPAACRVQPELAALRRPGLMLTGSGSAWFTFERDLAPPPAVEAITVWSVTG